MYVSNALYNTIFQCNIYNTFGKFSIAIFLTIKLIIRLYSIEKERNIIFLHCVHNAFMFFVLIKHLDHNITIIVIIDSLTGNNR